MTKREEYEFGLSNRAFDLFTLAERERALKRFSTLEYQSITDRFFDAVHWVINQKSQAADGPIIVEVK